MTDEIKEWDPRVWPLVRNEGCYRLEELKFALKCRSCDPSFSPGELETTHEKHGNLFKHRCNRCGEVWAVPEEYPRYGRHWVACDQNHPAHEMAKKAQHDQDWARTINAYNVGLIGAMEYRKD